MVRNEGQDAVPWSPPTAGHSLSPWPPLTSSGHPTDPLSPAFFFLPTHSPSIKPCSEADLCREQPSLRSISCRNTSPKSFVSIGRPRSNSNHTTPSVLSSAHLFPMSQKQGEGERDLFTRVPSHSSWTHPCLQSRGCLSLQFISQ